MFATHTNAGHSHHRGGKARWWGYFQGFAGRETSAWQVSLLSRRKFTRPSEVTKMRQPVTPAETVTARPGAAALHFAQARVQRQTVSPQHGLQGNLYASATGRPMWRPR